MLILAISRDKSDRKLGSTTSKEKQINNHRSKFTKKLSEIKPLTITIFKIDWIKQSAGKKYGIFIKSYISRTTISLLKNSFFFIIKKRFNSWNKRNFIQILNLCALNHLFDMHNIYMERLSLPSELTYTGPRLKGQATQFQ